jgi:hypothetical protein
MVYVVITVDKEGDPEAVAAYQQSDTAVRVAERLTALRGRLHVARRVQVIDIEEATRG